ncbi:MAG: DUF4351 domain-containing protein [Acidobacteriota bacterium]
MSREPIRADSVILSAKTGEIFHIEFQTTAQSKIPLPLRMLDYYVGLKRLHLTNPIRQVLIVLKATGEKVVDEYRDEHTHHAYTVVRMWEQDAKALMKFGGLLPLAALCRTESGESLLSELASRIGMLKSSQQRRETLTFSQVLAGLRYNKNIVYGILKESDMLEESSVYQDILQKGVKRGLVQGEQNIVLRLLTRKLGRLSPKIHRQIESLSSKQLEKMSDELLDFKTKADLIAWLDKNSSTH